MAKRQKEGFRVKDVTPFGTFMPYIMVERSDSQNTITDSFDVAPTEKFIKEMRAEGLEAFGVMHVILASYVRMVSQRPRTNRYIRGQKIYGRNDIAVSLTIKRKMSLEGEDTTVKMHFRPDMDVYEVYNEVNTSIQKALQPNDTDKTAKILCYIPGLLRKFVVRMLKLMDYFGLLPKFLIEASPFHCSMFITSMASLNIPPIRHHLYNFGNCPLFIAFGAKRTVYDFTDEGEPFKKRVIDFVVNMDERTTDGYYWASSLKVFKSCVSHPEILKKKPETVIKDF